MKLFTAWSIVAVALYGSAAGVSAGRMRTSLRQKAAVDPAATKVIALDTSIVPTWEELGGAELTQKVRLYRVVKFWKALEARDKEEAALLFADPDDESAATAKIDAFYEGALNCLYQQRELEHTDTVYTDITLINIKLCIIKDVKIPKFNVLPSQDWPVDYRKGVLVDFLEAEKTQTEEEKEADAKAAEKLATSPAVVEGNADAPQDTGDVTLPPTDTSASSSDAPLVPSSIDENPDTSAPSGENPDTTAPSDENPDTSAPSGSSDENPNDVPGTNGSDSSNDEDNTNAPSGSQPSGDQPGENPSEPDTSAPSGSQPASDQPGENPSEPDTNAPSGSQPSADQPNQPDQPGENPSEPDTNAPSGSQTTGDQPNGDQPSENPSEPDTSAPSGSQPTGDQPEQPDQPGENPAEPDTAAPSGSQPTGDQPGENPSEPDTSAPSGSQPGENPAEPDTASPSGSQPTGDQPGENPSEPDTSAPSGSQPGETPSEPTTTEPITEEPLVPTVPAALTVPAADVRTDVVAPDPSSWKLDPRSPNVPPLWALDWDRSNSVSKKEWYLYLNRIEKVASGIIAETNSQDAKAVQLLSQLVDFHYTVLRMCIDKKFSQDNISTLQSPEFEVAAQWIEDNCYVKFRYSLLGQLPPFQLIAKAQKTITPKEAEVWFAKQVKIAKNDLNVKQIVGTASGMENMLDYLNTCTFELLQAAGKELINREIFYAAEDQITKCTMAKLGMS